MKRRRHSLSFIIAVGALAVVALTPGPAVGQVGTLCGMRNDLARDLAGAHEEIPVSWGLIGDSHMVEVFAAPKGSFTIVITRPDGLACVLAAGEHWQDYEARTRDKPTPL